jgi:hypothetical protein
MSAGRYQAWSIGLSLPRLARGGPRRSIAHFPALGLDGGITRPGTWLVSCVEQGVLSGTDNS